MADRQLDGLVRELYGLSAEEIAIVEGESRLTRADFEFLARKWRYLLFFTFKRLIAENQKATLY